MDKRKSSFKNNLTNDLVDVILALLPLAGVAISLTIIYGLVQFVKWAWGG